MIINKNELEIRKMVDTEEDYHLMEQWLTNSRVLEFYEGRDKVFDLDRIKEKYQPRILGIEKVTPCIILFKDNPIGYIQYYELSDEQKEEYEIDKANVTYGIDLFIGDPRYWSQGLGSRSLSLLISYLFSYLNADLMTIDPRVDNIRAIKSYEKVGFKKVKVLQEHELHEGKKHDSWLMTLRKSDLIT